MTSRNENNENLNRGNQNQEEADFLANYDIGKYPSFALTVDLNIFTIRNGALKILLVQRGGHPFKGFWALPGGFVSPEETPLVAAQRELVEETNVSLDKGHLEQLGTYYAPNRDPRGNIVSSAYVAMLPHISDVAAGDDAVEAHFFDVADVLSDNEEFPLAFDHKGIIKDALNRVRDKIEWSPLAMSFLDEVFTISDLRTVYEIVWGVKLHEANFRRKVQSVNDLIVPVGRKGEANFPVGRSADLYRAGSATMLYPALLRPHDGPESD